MKIGSATKEFLVWLALVASTLALAGTIVLAAKGAEQPPTYCEGMARPAEGAECPPANAKKTGGEAAVPCVAPGRDCVDEWLIPSGQYCGWAANLAEIGAYFRRQEKLDLGQTLAKLDPQLKRPLTSNEVKHIHFWLTYGWMLGGVHTEASVFLMADTACRKGRIEA